jgi:hypothetical protein
MVLEQIVSEDREWSSSFMAKVMINLGKADIRI